MNKILVFLVLLLVATGVPAQIQRAILHDQPNCLGASFPVSEVYFDNLASVNWDNRIQSVRVFGIWLFYQDINFNDRGGRAMEWRWDRNNECANTSPNTISSLRFAGHARNFSGDSLTLYQYDFFQGQEEFLTMDTPNLNSVGRHESIIITGNSHWTVYDRPNYQGNFICLRVPQAGSGTPSFITDVRNVTPQPIPAGSIRSARKGCRFGGRMAELKSF